MTELGIVGQKNSSKIVKGVYKSMNMLYNMVYYIFKCHEGK